MKFEPTGFRAMACTWMLALAFAIPAQAEQGPDYAATGPYAGLGVAFAWDNFNTPIDFDPAYGFDAWGGYRFLPFMAAELQIEYLNGFDFIVTDAEAVTFTGNLKAYLPLGRVQPFVLAGIGLGYVKNSVAGIKIASDTAFAARFGGGIDFWLTESWALQASTSYVLQTGDLDGLDYVSLLLGAQFRF